MSAAEAFLEVLSSGIFTSFAFHAVVVVICISFICVVVYTALSNIKNIFWNTCIVTLGIAFLFVIVIIANIALQDAKEDGKKKLAEEFLGIFKFVIRKVEGGIFGESLLEL